jgi:hypothetical protein
VERQYLDYLKDSKKIVLDASDTIILGNAAYGAIFIPLERAKKGRLKDAAGLFLNGLRLYAKSKLKSPNNGWEKENMVLDDLYRVLDRYHVTREEMEKATERYVNSRLFQQKGCKDCLEKLRNYGNKKELILFTRESKESADAVKKHFSLDKAISQITKYKPDNTINDVEFVMKTPEDRLSVLKERVGTDVVMISDNDGDRKVLEGSVGLYISKSNKGDVHFNNWKDLSKQLDSG